jgi:hypothetical protein
MTDEQQLQRVYGEVWWLLWVVYVKALRDKRDAEVVQRAKEMAEWFDKGTLVARA